MPHVSTLFEVLRCASCRNTSIVFCGMTTGRNEPASSESERSYWGFWLRSKAGLPAALLFQAEPEKFVVVHLAKNGEEDVDLPDSEDDAADAAAGEHTAHGAQSVDDIDTQALANQWISAFKMIPGSFQVLGIFIAGFKPNLVEESTFTIAKKLLYDVHNLLIQSKNSTDDVTSSEYLFLAYSTTIRKAVCKNYTHGLNGGTFTPMDCRFVEKPFEWYAFECSYELDDVFPIIDATQRINIEHQFQNTIASVRKSLDVSEIFIQNESVDDALTLANYNKRRIALRSKGSVAAAAADAAEILKATIFLPVKCQISGGDAIKVRQFNGTIRFSGVISSRIWCNPKNTFGDVKRFVRDDILRSLAARIQVYCDGLTETNVSHDVIFISEPPRRVYFSLPSAAGIPNPIQFSEYIFRGEAPTVAVAQAKQILDLDINSEAIVADLEGLPDDDAFGSDFSMSDLETSMGIAGGGAGGGGGKPKAAPTKSERDLSRTMYMLGIAVALLVLFVSILLHYLLQK